MLTGALIGAGIGIVVALISLLFGKPRECPECGRRLRTPWLRPLEECPHCDAELRETGDEEDVGRPRAAGGGVLAAAIVLVVAGLGLFAVMLPGALESRRVWQYQEGRVEEKNREIRDLERRGDPASRAKAEALRDELRRSGWYPESHREEFVQRAAIAGLGVMLAFAGLGVFALRLVARRAESRRYDDEEEDQE
jgi:hypothetical protein